METERLRLGPEDHRSTAAITSPPVPRPGFAIHETTADSLPGPHPAPERGPSHFRRRVRRSAGPAIRAHQHNGPCCVGYAYRDPGRKVYATPKSINRLWTCRGLILGLAGNGDKSRQATVGIKSRSWLVDVHGGRPAGEGFRPTAGVDDPSDKANGTTQPMMPTIEGVPPMR